MKISLSISNKVCENNLQNVITCNIAIYHFIYSFIPLIIYSQQLNNKTISCAPLTRKTQ